MRKFKRTFGFILSHPLAKKHFFRSSFRFMYWQLQKRLKPEGYIVKKFIAPVKFYARKSMAGITGNIYTGLHEFDTMSFLLHLLRSDDTFFDVGANVGSYTLLAAGNCKANTVAIEPIPSTFNILADNIELNKLQHKVNLVNAAAGDENGSLTFTAEQDTTNHVVMPGEVLSGTTIDIPVIRIDEIIANAPVLIKMDVEGFESRALNGMPLLLANNDFKALIIELSDTRPYGYNDNYTRALLTSHGFSPFDYDPFKRELIPITEFNRENYIYCRDIDFISNRLKNASPIKIMGELV